MPGGGGWLPTLLPPDPSALREPARESASHTGCGNRACWPSWGAPETPRWSAQQGALRVGLAPSSSQPQTPSLLQALLPESLPGPLLLALRASVSRFLLFRAAFTGHPSRVTRLLGPLRPPGPPQLGPWVKTTHPLDRDPSGSTESHPVTRLQIEVHIQAPPLPTSLPQLHPSPPGPGFLIAEREQ